MGIRLVYGLRTGDNSYLAAFYPSRRLAEAMAGQPDYGAFVFPPGASVAEAVRRCRSHVALLRGELPQGLYEALERAGVRVVNPSGPTELARDKWATALFFASRGVRHPETVSVGAVKDGPLGSAFPLPFPFVAKPRYGKMGRGVERIDGPADWSRYLERAGGELIAQRLVAASAGRDVRFFFARWEDGAGPTAVCVLREGQGFLSNAHAGARMTAFEPPPALALEARRVFESSGLDYGTVDFLFEDSWGGSFSACEMNSCPGFEELERATGLDAAAAIARTVMAVA